MISIRLARYGAKKRPFYYLVAVDSKKPLRSNFVEKLGFYDPMAPKESEMRFKFNPERVAYRISVGGQPSERVKFLLNKAGFALK